MRFMPKILSSPVLASSNPLKQHCVILVLNKTKAALHGGQCQSTKLIQAQHNTLIDLVKRQPFGSMPRCCNSFLIMRFSHAESVASPSSLIAVIMASSKDGSIRNAICLLPFGIFVFDMCLTLGVIFVMSNNVHHVSDTCKARNPVVLATHTGLLTTNAI